MQRILISFWSTLAGRQKAKPVAGGYGRQLWKGENMVARLRALPIFGQERKMEETVKMNWTEEK